MVLNFLVLRQPELYVEMVDIDGMALASAEMNTKNMGLDLSLIHI